MYLWISSYAWVVLLYKYFSGLHNYIRPLMILSCSWKLCHGLVLHRVLLTSAAIKLWKPRSFIQEVQRVYLRDCKYKVDNRWFWWPLCSSKNILPKTKIVTLWIFWRMWGACKNELVIFHWMMNERWSMLLEIMRLQLSNWRMITYYSHEHASNACEGANLWRNFVDLRCGSL